MIRSDEQGNISHYLCIGCPLGCRLEVEEDEQSTIVEVRGWSCRRGDTYARQEHVDPRRVVTTTVRIRDGMWARLPVKSDGDVPKGIVHQICDELGKLTISAPVQMGDVIVSNILGTGADIVATRDMGVAQETT